MPIRLVFLCLFFGPLLNAQWASNHGIIGHEGLQTIHSSWWSADYRPIQFTGFQQSDHPHFAGIWEKRPSPYYNFYYGMNQYWLEKRINEFATDGYRITSLEHYMFSGEVRYIAIWEKWNGLNRTIDTLIQLSSFAALLSQRAGEDYLPLDIDVINHNGTLKVSLIRESTGN